MAPTRNKRKSPKLNANVGNSTTSLVLALGIGAAILFWWRARRGKDSGEGDAKRKPRRSPFKFPDAKSSAPSSLPRNKSSNNKKNKARKHAEKQHRAEKRAAPPVKEDPKKSEEQASASTAVINYTYFDSARRDTILPTHKKKTLTAADVMKSDSKATDS